MSEVVYIIQHLSSLPHSERSAQAKRVLAMQTWIDSGGWQIMSTGTGWKFEVVIETSAGPNDSLHLRAPVLIPADTDLRSIYWRPRHAYRMPAAGDVV